MMHGIQPHTHTLTCAYLCKCMQANALAPAHSTDWVCLCMFCIMNTIKMFHQIAQLHFVWLLSVLHFHYHMHTNFWSSCKRIYTANWLVIQSDTECSEMRRNLLIFRLSVDVTWRKKQTITQKSNPEWRSWTKCLLLVELWNLSRWIHKQTLMDDFFGWFFFSFVCALALDGCITSSQRSEYSFVFWRWQSHRWLL